VTVIIVGDEATISADFSVEHADTAKNIDKIETTPK